jgi:hypothetical protein
MWKIVAIFLLICEVTSASLAENNHECEKSFSDDCKQVADFRTVYAKGEESSQIFNKIKLLKTHQFGLNWLKFKR